jgi:hypothetical protein
MIDRSGSPPKFTKSIDMLMRSVAADDADFGFPLKTKGFGFINGRVDFRDEVSEAPACISG